MSIDPKHPETKYKSAYYLGDKLLSFFLNYNENNKSFSFIIKKGAYSFIYNLTSEEKMPVVRTMLRQLSIDELRQVVKELEIERGI
jgi:hypothetical protein